MGFYPVCPGVPEYVFGSPLFDKVSIQLENGRTFVIESAGADGDREDSGKDLRYIQKCMLNGGSYRKTYISHDDIMKGGSLVFTMGDMPGGAFNTIGEALPYSLSNE
jgi:putative alpha-1,2-mannosidase